MSAGPAPRGGSPWPAGSSAGSTAWPGSGDRGNRAPRPDVLAAVLTVLGGAAGMAQLFLSWTSVVSGVALAAAGGGVTGWERFLGARTGASLSVSDFITAYSVVGTALAGGALLLLGLAMFLPVDHRPLGAVGLVLATGMFAAALWWLIAGRSTFSQSVADLFVHAGVGWYLFLVAGPLAILGSVKALSTG